MSEALNLYRLQKLDTQINRITTRLEEIERKLSDDSRVRHAQKSLEKAEAHVKQRRIQLNQIEDKVETQRIKRKRTQASLFGGKIKNPKELQDLQMESEALKKYISQLEDEQLEAMIAYEAAENAEKQATIDLEKTMGTVSEENASMLGEKNKLEIDLERLTREKDAVLQSISAKALNLYQALLKSKGGVAVAAVTEGGCSICGQSLTPGDLQSIRASNKLVFCPSCGRILFAE
ncbi:MAG: C4-type zinc ribbon domain-containing protein [Chloroflexota bacterium]|nr:C4-type zinc ribbon domain-containing protein [Chloroflexota bacterium]